ncbi:MAG TPA: hypothetical protein VFF16_15635 [Telluria sp.]|nr:hypothetical protein [Telluria sp.]
MRSYLWIFGTAAGTAVAGAVLLNYAVDPYLTHQWRTPAVERLRAPREKLSAWGKTYAVARYRPEILYLGNSRTELALAADYPAFASSRVFNAALSGASLADAAAMARHALAVSRPRMVVWGVDAPSFSNVVGTRDFDRALVGGAGAYLAKRVLLDAQRALSWDMTEDALREVAGKGSAVCRSSLARRGQRDDACIRDFMRAGGGTAKAVRARLRDFVRAEGPTPAALTLFEATLGQLCAAGVQVRLYVNPVHASMYAALSAAGKWRRLEQWQTDLTRLAAAARGRQCDARLFDFGGFNRVTTEPLPQASGQAEMSFYWEPSHYRERVGHMILDRLAGTPGFGVELTPASVAEHLAAQREGLAAYIAAHPVEAALAREAAANAFKEER